ncbi:hypothetical protein ACGFNU_50605 [Spirillospora sp. NPDC048911]|uniref:hypothetical protein n=1 Tax=Spirillospora sp. NPDC048911 TaxID=3364527 RepID=UPI00372036E2
MSVPDEAPALFQLARGLLAGLEQAEPRAPLAEYTAVWEASAHQCRELANRVVLATATAATADTEDTAAAERRRLLGELAVMLAVNAEWAVAICQPHRTAQDPADPQALRAWGTARTALHHTAVGVLRMLTISHQTPDDT